MLDARVRGAFATVEEVYRMAGAALWRPPGAPAIAAALFGPACLEDDENVDRFVLYADDGQWVIAVSPWLEPDEMNLAVADAIAHWVLQRDGYEEPSAVIIAAGILLPPSSLALAIGKYGFSTEEIARRYRCPERVVTMQRRLCFGDPSGPARSGEYLRHLAG